MIFLSLLFLVIALIVLIKGHLMNEMVNKLLTQMNEYKDKADELSTEDHLGIVLKILYVIGFQVAHVILWTIFLVKALSIDIYIYPTVIMIAIFIITILHTVIKYERNKKLKDEFKSKTLPTRTLWRTTEAIIEIAYFGYILWMLLFN